MPAFIADDEFIQNQGEFSIRVPDFGPLFANIARPTEITSDDEATEPFHSRKRARAPSFDEHKRSRYKVGDSSNTEYLHPEVVPISTSILTHADYTVGWICALPLEMQAARAMLDEEHPQLPIPSTDHNQYLLGSISGHNVVIACLPVGNYGTTSATVVTTHMTFTFTNCKIMPLMVGIGGGVPSKRHDIRLGDIVVSTPSSDRPAVVQYDRGKTIGTGVIDPRGTLSKPAHILLSAISAFQAQYGSRSDGTVRHITQALGQHQLSSCRYPGAEADVLYETSCTHESEETGVCKQCTSRRVERGWRQNTSPVIHYGTIGSGNQVIKHAATRDRIAAQHGDILCFEMEAAGIMDYIPCLVIRGICDYADAFKNKDFQGYAAIAAAAFAKELLTFMQPRAYGGILPPQRPRQIPRHSIMDMLNFPEAENRRATIKNAHPRTCTWLVETPEFLKWIDVGSIGEHHGLMWIKGKPGTGKSTIMKFLLERFEDTIENGEKPVITSFFFNARGQPLEKSAVGMYRSLLYQLLSQVPELPPSFGGISTETFKTDIHRVAHLEMLFKKVIVQLNSRRVLCLIDALDECPEDEVQNMVDYFKELASIDKSCRFQICFSSRHYPKISIGVGLELVLEEERGHDSDILDYIGSYLQIDGGDYAEKLKDDVFQKSKGVFLWVVLVIKILNREYSRGRVHTLDQTLQETPQGLDDLLSEILLRDPRNIPELVLCMQWILYSERPLERQELYFALLSTPRALASLPAYEIPAQAMDNYILDCSKGLVEMTRTEPPVAQFIHESVREVLLKPSTISNLAPLLRAVQPATSHQCLARCCNNYLTSKRVISMNLPIKSLTKKDKFNSDSSYLKFFRLSPEAQKELPFLKYSVEFVLKHADLAASMAVSQGEFLRTFNQGHWIGLYKALTNSKDLNFGLLLARHGLQSLLTEWARAVISTESGKICNVIEFLVFHRNREACHVVCQGLHKITAAPREDFENYFDTVYQLLEAVRPSRSSEIIDFYGVVTSPETRSLARLLIVRQAQRQQDDLDIALKFAATIKQENAIKLLLRCGASLTPSAVIWTAREPKGYRACGFRQQRVVQSVHETDSANKSSAEAATTADTLACLKLLVGRGLDINAKNAEGITALQEASVWARAELMDWLVDASNDINAIDSKGWTALHYAADGGNFTAARILLEKEAQPDIQNSDWNTALHLAIALKSQAIIDCLLRFDAKVHLTNMKGNSPLHLAVQVSDEEIVRKLLSKTSLISEPNNNGYTPLHFAVRSRNNGLVELILQAVKARSANLNVSHQTLSKDNAVNPENPSVDHDRNHTTQPARCTPMCLSIMERGNTSITKTLLDHGIHAHLQICSHVPLHRAVVFNNLDLVRLLLKQVDVNEQDKQGRTALHQAAKHGATDGVLELIMQQKPNSALADEDGNTALHLAGYHGRQHMVTVLLEYDASITAANHRGRTAFQMAAFGESKVVAKLLWKHGSKAELPARGDESNWQWSRGARVIFSLEDLEDA